MKIDHVAVWAKDLEYLRSFYTKYFDAVSGGKYVNPSKGFASYFMTFCDGGARLELMTAEGLDESESERRCGLAHIAISVGSRAAVDALTERLRADGYAILGEARTTGDGYYESVIADPEGNMVEITV